MAQPLRYTYHAITHNDIRLLTIHPGGSRDGIQLALSVVPLAEARGQYEALSYRWGDPEPPQMVIVEDSAVPGARQSRMSKLFRSKSEPRFALNISPNLYDALTALRHPKQPVVMWIDQICINQGDLEERKQQVRLMDRIYGYATTTLVWLGMEAWANKAVLQNIKYLIDQWATLSAYDDVESRLDLRLGGNDPARRDIAAIPQVEWEQFLDFLRNPYFRRAWIVQEIVLCRNYVYLAIGGERFNFGNLSGLVPYLADTFESSFTSYITEGLFDEEMKKDLFLIQNISNMQLQVSYDDGSDGYYQRQMPRKSLADLLVMTWHTECTDSRDKVYSLKGILETDLICRDTVRIDPDYTVDPQGVLRNIFVECYRRGDFKTLHYVHPNTTSSFPCWMLDPDVRPTPIGEWVADRKHLDSTPQKMSDRGSEAAKYSAGNFLVPTVDFAQGDMNTLFFKASPIGRVWALGRQKGEIPDPSAPSDSSATIVSSFLTKHQKADCRARFADFHAPFLGLPEGQTLWPDGRKIWTFEDMDTKLVPRPPQIRKKRFSLLTRKEKFRRVKNVLTGSYDGFMAEPDADDAVKDDEMYNRTHIMNADQRACCFHVHESLQSGLGLTKAGWVPDGIQKGDEVFLIHGMSLPMLARLSANGRYRFQGACYLDGVMHGELNAMIQSLHSEFILVS